MPDDPRTLAVMNGFYDDPEDVIADGVAGIAAARPDITWESDGFLHFTGEADGDGRGEGRVAVISGGGSGHEPMHAGFLGSGMLDAVCPGHVFTSPNTRQLLAATRAVDRGAGVVHVVKNYTGDVMNFGAAAKLAGEEGIDVATVTVADDAATSDGGIGGRGTAATILVEKVAGAAAARGDSLADVARIAQDVADRSATIAVSLSGCRIPGAEASFELGEGELEFGVGIHGERGVRRLDHPGSVRRIVDTLLDRLLPAAGDPRRVLLLVNGLGGTPELEVSAAFAVTARALDERGVDIARVVHGEFVTAWDMTGFSITVLGLDDGADDILDLLDEPTTAPAWEPPTAYADCPDVTLTGAEDLPDGDDPDGPGHRRLSAWVSRVLDSVDDLTELDRTAGDGDFGVNMRAALAPLASPLRGTAAGVLDAIGQSYLVRAGGTSGAVFGLFFATMARNLEDAGELEAETLAPAVRAGLDAIVDLGGAKVGDCTVVDAIDPAVRALEDGGGLAGAARAAAEGTEATAGTAAGKGRASYVGDAAKGVVDPGALVMSWFFEELAG